MHVHRLTATLGFLAAGFVALAGVGRAEEDAPEQERNRWPIVVEQAAEPGRPAQWTAAGPLIFGRMTDEDGRIGGFRPLWVQRVDSARRIRARYFLYPLFSYRTDGTTFHWNVLELIRRTDRHADAPPAGSIFESRGELEIWPFWFSRQSGDPELNYRALFPLAGTIRNKLGFDRASWVVFPLYMQAEKRGATTTFTPWPIVRVTRGTARGFGIWPLFETRERPGRWRQSYILWPLGYDVTAYPASEAPAGTPPTRDIGVLPLYARHTGPGQKDETFLWPFFGYTDRTQPARYHETRYFWPLLVQGRGDARYVNRWGPVYTHSIVRGVDKTWYAWPLLRHVEWTERGLALERNQLLYFLYWSEQQRSATNPARPAAVLTHVWPLFSSWDNGAGRRQFQFLSPLDVFFPGNEKVREAWSPIFAIMRHEQTQPGESRTSLLWNALTWRRSTTRQENEFHCGPLFSISSRREERRVAIGNGLLAFTRDANGHWRATWLDFPTSKRQPDLPAKSPRPGTEPPR